jgi:NADH:ubiquinone oxidoreductase subunit E
MPSDEGTTEVVVCLGSSCFARGNSSNLSSIEAYVQNRGLCNCVRVRGSLCQDECKRGPNLSIGGTHHHQVTSAKMREILQQLGDEGN